MHLINAAVAVASTIVGTVGATVAYETLNTPPIEHPEPAVNAVTIPSYLPCEPPATLTDGVCLTTVVKTIVRTAKPRVITTVDTRSGSGGSGTVNARDEDEDEDDHEGEDDHDEEEHEDDDPDDHEDEDHGDEDHED